MDFILTEEQQAMKDMAQKFAQKELVPYIKEREEWGEKNKDKFDRTFIEKLGQAGLYGALYPEEYGGSAAGMVAQCLIMEEIMRYSLEAGFTYNQLSVNVPMGIFNWGTEEQKKKYIPRILNGELIGGFNLTEPTSGSDVANMNLMAKKEGDYYVLNGSKMWISLGHVADVLLTFARTNKDDKYHGITAFLIETKDLKGLVRKRMDIFTGTWNWPTGEMYFDDCKIPAEWMIGKEGEGFKIAMNTLHYGRVAVPSRAVGVSQACLDAVLRYTEERTSWGRPIADYQAIQHAIAEMVLKTESSRLLVYKAASLADHGFEFGRDASIAKLYAGEAAKWNSNKAFELFGGAAFSWKEYPVFNLYIAGQSISVGEGSQNLQRDLIAMDELGRKKIDRHHIKPKFCDFIKKD